MYIVPNMFADVQHTIGHALIMGEAHLSSCCRYLHRVEDKMLTEIRCLLYHKQLTLFFICYPQDKQ